MSPPTTIFKAPGYPNAKRGKPIKEKVDMTNGFGKATLIAARKGGMFKLEDNGNFKTSFSVNVNTATAAQLQAVPGIAAKTAQAIINHRNSRPITKIDELATAPGITKGRLSARSGADGPPASAVVANPTLFSCHTTCGSVRAWIPSRLLRTAALPAGPCCW